MKPIIDHRGRPAPTSFADLGALHDTLAKTGDPAIRAQLLGHYEGIAHKVADRVAGGGRQELLGQQHDDLIQVARMGLLKALDRFEPARGNSFTTYGWMVALGELRRHLRDHSWALHVPRRAKELCYEVRQSREELQQQLARSPTVGELAAHLRVTDDDVLDAIEVSQLQTPDSIDTGPDEEEGIELVSSEEGFDKAEYGTVLASLMDRLTPRERTIINLRFGQELTQAQIAERVGLSQMHVSRLITRILARLRRWSETEGIPAS